jgi:hypothetical protein
VQPKNVANTAQNGLRWLRKGGTRSEKARMAVVANVKVNLERVKEVNNVAKRTEIKSVIRL